MSQPLDAPFQVESPAALKGVLFLGPPFLALFAVSLVWEARFASFAPLRAFLWFGALFLACVAAAGLRLLRFVNTRLEVAESGVTLRSSQGSRSLPWADLRLRDRRALQITELLDRDGKLLFAIAWSGTNARRLVQAAVQRLGQQA